VILIDGVRYIDRTPSNEDDLEQVVREHSKDIWGEDSVYFDKKKLHTPTGIGSIPDGYVVVFRAMPQWFVVEVELSTHQLFEHIVPQISKFASGVSNTVSQSQIAAVMHKTIDQDDILKAWVKTRIGNTEVYKFLMDTVCRPPVLAIVIDEKTEQLGEVCDQLPTKFKSIEIVEFKTFEREGSGPTVHAHIFEPLQIIARNKSPATPARVSERPTPMPYAVQGEGDFLDVILNSPSCVNYHLFYVPKERRSFFPGYKVPFKLQTDLGVIETYVSSAPVGTRYGDPNAGTYVQANLSKWFRAHPEISVGSRLLIESVQHMKEYRLTVA